MVALVADLWNIVNYLIRFFAAFYGNYECYVKVCFVVKLLKLSYCNDKEKMNVNSFQFCFIVSQFARTLVLLLTKTN
jgi:hypothetical protein